MEQRFKHFTNSLGRIYCSLRYHENIRTLSVIWKGTAPDDDIASLKGVISEMIKQFEVDYILNDLEELFGDAIDSLIYLKLSEWDAEAFSLKIKQIVHVLRPETALADQYLKQENKNPHLKFFDNKVDAVMYLTGLNRRSGA
jgi:hypothetical protein